MSNEAQAAKLHELKCWPGPFEAIKSGEKTAEFRKDDRGFAVGDILQLRRFEPTGQYYTSEVLQLRITHVLRNGFGLPDGYCMLSLATYHDAQLRAANERIAALREALRGMVEIAELTIGWFPTPPGADGPLIVARAALATNQDTPA